MQQFKIGDWVRYYNRKEPFQITKIHNDTKGMMAKWKYVSGQYTYTEKMLEPWQPNESEWCCFYNGGGSAGDEQFTVTRYQGKDEFGYYLKSCYGKYTEIFKHCEPFIGQLPSCVQEQL